MGPKFAKRFLGENRGVSCSNCLLRESKQRFMRVIKVLPEAQIKFELMTKKLGKIMPFFRGWGIEKKVSCGFLEC